MKQIYWRIFAVVFVFPLQGCSSRKIEEKYVGSYCPPNTPANYYGNCFHLHYKGECSVGHEKGQARPGKCAISGNTLTMNTESTAPTFGYPEFREANVTLTIDGDTLTTLAGRKFIKKGSATESAQTSISQPSSAPSNALTNSAIKILTERLLNAYQGQSVLSKLWASLRKAIQPERGTTSPCSVKG